MLNIFRLAANMRYEAHPEGSLFTDEQKVNLLIVVVSQLKRLTDYFVTLVIYTRLVYSMQSRLLFPVNIPDFTYRKF